jgi:hypothetical protein
MNDDDKSSPESTSKPGHSQRHYSAFISYTDADRAMVARLQARLERYRLPPRLAERLGYSRIKPVFVDRTEMSAAPDLGDAIRDAIARSDFLIVACTPRTPKSQWVGKEIDLFRETHGSDRIMVALLEGDKQESFHSNLFAHGPDSEKEPLAADFRHAGDGYRLGLLKILAVLVGADLDELVLRDAHRQRKRTLTFGGIAILVALIIAVLGYAAYRASASLDEQRILASQAMELQLKELRDQIEQGGTLDMAAAVTRGIELFYDGQAASSDLPEVELGRAQLAQAKTEDDIRRTDYDSAATNARVAWTITSNLLVREPDNVDAIYSHAQSAFWLGYAAWLQRDTPLAANAFARYADLADRLVELEPDNSDFRLEQGFAYSNLGMIALREARDSDIAEGYFMSAQAAFQELARRNPDDPDHRYEMADGEAWLADVELLRQNFVAAQRHRDRQAELLRALLESYPRDQRFRIAFMANRIGQARLEAAQGRRQEALGALRTAGETIEELISSDPQNASLIARRRAIELFKAQNELALGSAAAIRRAEALIGDCSQDWIDAPDGELPVFCSVLRSRVALAHGQQAVARRIMGDPRLDDWIGSPTLSPIWRLDFQEECNRLGDPELC